MRRKVRLTESDLHKIVEESVNGILNEGEDFREIYIKIFDLIHDLEVPLAQLSRYDNDLWTPFRRFCDAVHNSWEKRRP